MHVYTNTHDHTLTITITPTHTYVHTYILSFTQCQDMAEKKNWLAAFQACFAEMAKTVVYGTVYTLVYRNRYI